MHDDKEHSADERTDTETYLLEKGVTRGDRAEPINEEDGSAHPPGYHDSPSAERSPGPDLARRDRNAASGEG